MSREERAAKISAAAPKERRPSLFVLATVVVLVMGIGVGLALWQGMAGRPTSGSGAVPKGADANGVGISAYPDVPVKAGAPEVMLFTDLQCPGCAALEKNNGAQLAQMAKSGEIRLKSMPLVFLDANLGQGPDGSSHQATAAAFCAADQGRYLEFSQYVFAHQPAQERDGFPASLYSDAAKAVGISGQALTTFERCVADGTYKDFVNTADEGSARNLPGGATPGLRINGTAVRPEDMTTLQSVPNSFKTVLAKY